NHGKKLFSSEFYSYCKKRLYKNGIFVAQNGIFFLQKQETLFTYKKLKKYFNIAKFYHSSIPTYYGGPMMFAWGTDNIKINQINLNVLNQRIKDTKINFFHYNAGIHISSFYLPQYILNALSQS
ncbi:polyamine aminopropyltransferase, partial [Buchnera aphidicola]|nr:polyamine aminopropyltransferase [Buchnera aphidicola]